AAGPDAPELVKLRQYFDHPLLIEMFADAIREAAATLPGNLRDAARSGMECAVKTSRASSRCGPDLYERQVGYTAGLVAAAAGYPEYDQVWQSRSGPPQVP
ncbi:ferrochelatase, partial [Mycobacterium sp. ITM-2017-0098]